MLKLKGAAELGARRRLRLHARQGAAAAPPRMMPDLGSSSSDEGWAPAFEEDGFDDVGVDMDGDDAEEEFDPCVFLSTPRHHV